MNPGIILIELVDTIIYAAVAGIGVATVFSIAIYGATRYVDLSQEDRRVAAFASGLLALVALALCLAAAAGGLLMMIG